MKLLVEELLIVLVVVFLQSCDLSLQRSYDFDESDHPPILDHPFEMTMYEFMTQHSEFDSLVIAANRAGMVDLFDEGSDDKTVLMLRNDAMVEFLNDEGYDAIDQVPVNTLQNLLNYHVITTRFTQEDLNSQDLYLFQTLTDGEDGIINIWKWRRYWQIQVNQNGSDLPGTAKGATVYLHNYQFTNGVGHQMNAYVRRTPF